MSMQIINHVCTIKQFYFPVCTFQFDLNREQDILLSHHPLKRLLQPTPYPKLWNTLVDLLNIYDDQVFPKPWVRQTNSICTLYCMHFYNYMVDFIA